MLVHSKILRWLARPLLPTGWNPHDFKTTDAIDVQRVRLEILGSRMFRLKIFSFVCKIVSVVTLFYARDAISPSRHSIIYTVTVLTVQAVPNALALLLFYQHLVSRNGQSGTTPMILPASRQELSNDVGATITESSVSDAPLQRPDVARVGDGSCQPSTHNGVSFYNHQASASVQERKEESSANAGVASSLPLADEQQSDAAAGRGVGARWMKGFTRFFSSRRNQSTATPLLQPL
jgi:hypothetical protein